MTHLQGSKDQLRAPPSVALACACRASRLALTHMRAPAAKTPDLPSCQVVPVSTLLDLLDGRLFARFGPARFDRMECPFSPWLLFVRIILGD
jgi:hypothetical protein